MGVSVKLVHDLTRTRRDGTAPVRLRIIVDRRVKYRVTGVNVTERDWNAERQQVRRSNPIQDALNAHLTDLKHKATEAALQGGSAEAVRRRLVGEAGSLTEFGQRYLRGLDDAGRFWEHKKYAVTLRKLHRSLGTAAEPAKTVTFASVDRYVLVRLERYLRETLGNAPNTIRKEMQRLGRVFAAAVREGAIKPDANPFALYDRPRGERPDRLKLAAADVLALAAVETDEPRHQLARDAFAFSFYGGGVRFSDVCVLKPEHVRDGRLRYRMLKTGSLVDLPLPPAALAIAERYAAAVTPERPFLFPMLVEGEDADPVRLRRRIASWSARVNGYLKAVAEAAELPDASRVSFHAARHAYAVFAASKSGDLNAISKALGHGSLAVTQAYLKSFDRDATDRLSEALWT